VLLSLPWKYNHKEHESKFSILKVFSTEYVLGPASVISNTHIQNKSTYPLCNTVVYVVHNGFCSYNIAISMTSSAINDVEILLDESI